MGPVCAPELPAAPPCPVHEPCSIEGLDERVIQKLQPLEVSLGDFVLSGGELAAPPPLEVLGPLQQEVRSDGATDVSGDEAADAANVGAAMAEKKASEK